MMKVLHLMTGALAAMSIAFALPVLAAEAGDAASGADKKSMCAGCHGIPGYHTVYPEVYKVPKLGGQYPGYIVKALMAYKSGERAHPTMRAIATSLSEKDMADLAAYYGGSGSKTAAAK
jgi:cytochrome c553